MESKKIKYKCKSGKTRTLDVNIGQDRDFIENLVVYKSGYPDNDFLPECKDCKLGEVGMQIGDDLQMHVVKVCEISKV